MSPRREIRVVLPAHLKNLARAPGEVLLDAPGEPAGGLTVSVLLDALEARFPVLRGTIRDRATGRRRAFVRFYACGQDLSNDDPEAPLPAEVASALAVGREPFLVVGAMAGG
jgi:sulfur-carrier protein